MIVIHCDVCGRELEPGDVFAVDRGDGWEMPSSSTGDSRISQAKRHLCSRDCGELLEAGAPQAKLRPPFSEEQRVWLRYALDAALQEAQSRLPYAQAQAEAAAPGKKPNAKWRRNLKALEARIQAFQALSEQLR